MHEIFPFYMAVAYEILIHHQNMKVDPSLFQEWKNADLQMQTFDLMIV